MRLFTIMLGVNIMCGLPHIFGACCGSAYNDSHNRELEAALDQAFDEALAEMEGDNEVLATSDQETEGKIVAEGTFVLAHIDEDYGFEFAIQYLDNQSILRVFRCEETGNGWGSCQFVDGWYEEGDPMRVTEIESNYFRFEKYFSSSSDADLDRGKQ